MTTSLTSLDPLERQPLAERVAASLRRAILAGTILPRQRIIEMEVAGAMQVSRAPVREALVSLEREGLVRRTANRGAVVLELTPADEIEIRALRIAHEACAIRLVIRRGDGECVRLLRENQRQMASTTDGAEKIRLDLEFHETIVRAAQNSRLLDDWSRLRRQIELLMAQRERRGDDTRALTVTGHERIIRAIESADESAAVAEIERQLLED